MSRSLHLYRHARLIVLSQSATATEAALAMQTNEIGCVVVTGGTKIVGIVTDRDLALRVIGGGRDPQKTRLREIMSSPVTSLDVNAPHDSALRLMREGRVRRVPLVEGSRVVGMVTFDDLVLERTASFDELVAIVQAQIVEGGPARTRRFDEWTSLARRHSRALGTKAKLLASIRGSAKLLSNEQAERALELVLDAFVAGVDEEVRARLIARLPVALRGRLREVPAERRRAASHRELDGRVARELRVDRARAAEIVDAVGSALRSFIRASDAVGRKLPADLRGLLVARAPRRARVARRSSSPAASPALHR